MRRAPHVSGVYPQKMVFPGRPAARRPHWMTQVRAHPFKALKVATIDPDVATAPPPSDKPTVYLQGMVAEPRSVSDVVRRAHALAFVTHVLDPHDICRLKREQNYV